jgi:hypothetical protein
MNELKAFDKYLKIALKIAVPIYIFNGEVKKIPGSQHCCHCGILPFSKTLARI